MKTMPIIRLSIPVVLLLIHYVNCITGEPICLKETPCSCHYNDGTGIDLKGLLAPNESLTLKLSNSSIVYFHPCTDINLLPNVTVKTTCSSASLCLQTNTSYTKIGNVVDVQFLKVPAPDLDTYKLTYTHTDPVFTTNIQLDCLPNDKSSYLHEFKLTSTSLDLILFSPLSCRHELPNEHGTSTGTVFLLILLLSGIIYFCGGAVLLYFLRGARGREMIPNVDFWTDLPYLVRDGAIFLQNGCKISSTGQNVYDQI